MIAHGGEAAPTEAFGGIDVLHIGKTGGTALRTCLRPFAGACGLRLRDHEFGLADVAAGRGVLFCVREPLARFVSGFNSRLRQGMPRNRLEWSPQESAAFARFATANLLAEALSDTDAGRRSEAIAAMAAIRHVARRLTRWLVSPDYLRARRADILWIGHQPDLDADFPRLKRLLGLPDGIDLPRDPIEAHHTPAGFDTTLSDRAGANLRAWYAQDIVLYDAAMALRREGLAQPPSRPACRV